MLLRLKQLFKPIPKKAKALMAQDWRQARFLSIDLELTGLDSESNEIVSIGWQPIEQQQLNLYKSGYSVCKIADDSINKLAQSPSIHGITERQLKAGIDIQKILQRLAPYANTHIWVFHNVELDMAILRRYLRHIECMPTSVVTLDTLQLQRHFLQKQSHIIKTDSATLSASRKYFNLPPTRAHHALDDAFATAELLLAQLHKLSSGRPMMLHDLQHTRALRVWKDL